MGASAKALSDSFWNGHLPPRIAFLDLHSIISPLMDVDITMFLFKYLRASIFLLG